MKKFADLFSLNKNLSHAYLIVGEPDSITQELKNFFTQKFGEDFVSLANPDFSLKKDSLWSIAESRELKNFNSRRPVKYSAKISVIIPETITLEAQNSLLKTLEEPALDTHFFIITKRLDEYLPTIISRCEIIRFENKIFPPALCQLAEEWLNDDLAIRLEKNKIILAQQENNPTYIVDWLNCLIDVYWNKVSLQMTKKSVSSAEALIKAISYASQRGGSPRIILDNLAGIVSND